MTKSVLLLFSRQSFEAGKVDPENLTNLLQAESKDSVEYVSLFLDDLIFKVGKKTSITNPADGIDLKDFDAVYFRNWEPRKSEAMSVAMYLYEHGVPLVDTEVLGSGSISKMTQYFRFWESGFAIPQTVFLPEDGSESAFETLEKDLGLPFVMKQIMGTRGEGNFLIDSLEAFQSAHTSDGESRYAYQEFIENDCDYRVFVVDEEAPLVIKRTNPGEYLNNVSQGGAAELIDAAEVGSTAINQSIDAASAFNREVAGVDFILRDGKPVFLEVNRAPQIDAGASYTAEKVAALATHLEALTEDDAQPQNLNVIGRAMRVDFPKSGVSDVPAKIDTGAYRTSVWATNIEERDGSLFFTLLGPESEYYSGKEMSVDEFEIVDVENSFGHSEQRYSIMLSIRLAGRRVRTNVTLSDRSSKTYPILIGRKLLKGKFVVDVSKGDPIPDEEK